MKTALKIVGVTLLVFFTAWGETNSETRNPKTNYSASVVWTNIGRYDPGTNFLTITNREYVFFAPGQTFIRVTDAEWEFITNHYPDQIQTNRIEFYGKRK